MTVSISLYKGFLSDEKRHLKKLQNWVRGFEDMDKLIKKSKSLIKYYEKRIKIKRVKNGFM